MERRVVCMFDSKVGAYGEPKFVRSRGEAERSVEEAVAEKDHPLRKFPGDFTLFEVGVWDDQTGLVTSHKEPQIICTALECLARHEESQRLRKVN